MPNSTAIAISAMVTPLNSSGESTPCQRQNSSSVAVPNSQASRARPKNSQKLARASAARTASVTARANDMADSGREITQA